MSHACHRFWKWHETLTFCSLLTRCTIPCACHAKRHLNVQKWREHEVLRTWNVFSFLTCKCASRHHGVHFFDISPSKSGPRMVCFAHFDFEMCFAPQRRALFRHLNFQKWSENGVFCTFWLRNVFRAISRHNGVQFFISHLARWLRTHRFSEPTFRPPEPQIIGKTQCFATFVLFRASASSFFWLFLFSDLLSLLFSSLWLFPSLLFICPYCRKFDF